MTTPPDSSKRWKCNSEEFAFFVEHPRYGKGPRYTGLNPELDYSKGTFFHWHSGEDVRIANTAIVADLAKQASATVPVTHYFDVKRVCVDCQRPFIFLLKSKSTGMRNLALDWIPTVFVACPVERRSKVWPERGSGMRNCFMLRIAQLRRILKWPSALWS